MNYDEPKVHVGVERLVKDRDGSTTKYTVNLSQIPLTASRSTIEMMLSQVQTGLELIMEEIDARVCGVVIDPKVFHNGEAQQVTPPRLSPEPLPLSPEPLPDAFSPLVDAAPVAGPQGLVASPILPPAPAGVDDPKQEFDKQELDDFDFDAAYVKPEILATDSDTPFVPMPPLPKEPAASNGAPTLHVEAAIPDAKSIPDDADIRTSGEAFGIEVDFPPYDWLIEPITRVGGEGEGGQLKALNSALTGAGYGKNARHPCAEVILEEFGPIHDQAPRHHVDSLNDLSKAEAHVLLSWFEQAGPIQLVQLGRVARPRLFAQKVANG